MRGRVCGAALLQRGAFRDTAYLPGLCGSSLQAVVAQGQKMPLTQSTGAGVRNLPQVTPQASKPSSTDALEKGQVNTGLAAALLYYVLGRLPKKESDVVENERSGAPGHTPLGTPAFACPLLGGRQAWSCDSGQPVPHQQWLHKHALMGLPSQRCSAAQLCGNAMWREA